ncbi:DUF4214 domain-containing protein [Massilia sp. SM-13]|uniref:DUF4214 domain-containing protein n=1 Tax=Pseudoduganella rhizocola TaxID=3382643 RepID=UPI0038B454E5
MSPRLFWFAPLIVLASCGGGGPEGSNQTQPSGAQVRSAAGPSRSATSSAITLPYQRAAYFVSAADGGSVARLVDDPSDAGIFVPKNAAIRFSDTSLLPYVEDGNMASVYRLYRAAFARKPDASGLLYWIGVRNGGASLESIAQGFVSSPEFKGIYGQSSTDPAIITGLYRNVLERDPDPSGLQYWQGVQRQGAALAQILEAFSESPENRASIATQIVNGLSFKEDGVAYPGTGAPGATIELSLSGTRAVGSTLVIKSIPARAVSAQASYTWTLMGKPTGSQARVDGAASQLSFTPDLPGTYQVGLVINDGGSKFNGSLQIRVTEQRLLNTPYLAKNGMTVTLERLTVTERGTNYVDYKITYLQANNTALAIEEGTWKLYFGTAAGMPQYGAFNHIYPGESLRRTYTWTQLKSETPAVMEYDRDNFFREFPASDSLRWPVPIN